MEPLADTLPGEVPLELLALPARAMRGECALPGELLVLLLRVTCGESTGERVPAGERIARARVGEESPADPGVLGLLVIGVARIGEPVGKATFSEGIV